MSWQLDINRITPHVALSRPQGKPVRDWSGHQATRLLAYLRLPAGRSLCSKQTAHQLWLVAAMFDLEDSPMPMAAFMAPTSPARHDVAYKLRNHGISPTPQRLLVGRILFTEPREHLTADQILARLQAQGGGCSRATVYNTLNLFVAQGLIKALTINAERTYYDSDTTPHAHIYNIDKGQVSDLPLDRIAGNFADALPTGVKLVDTNIVLQVRTG
ncbi:MAG TPA: Fur family transcriptional regulator [Gammaproteobacteria bacterium]|nr:Fur family transcriptional regulator [Gammaproteobacteria bacterium]